MQARSTSNIKGIDVSHHNGVIDWSKVVSDGVKFVYIKASEGVGYTDPKLKTNASGSNSVGLKTGYYHYARPETGNSAQAEAKSFVEAVKSLPATLPYPYVLDIEGAASRLGKAALTKWSVEWLEEVKRLTGREVMVYTGASFARTYCGPELGRYPLWVAHYGGVNTPMSNTTWSKWAVFQFTETGQVAGINGKVDINVMEADFMSEKRKTDYEGHWAESAIKVVMDAGIMNGRSKDKFAPNETITRAEVAVIVNRLMKMSK
ncbi:GH25 family lysozyme [Paenibacillus dendritiformis]|uniref:GH25 family lysozyme n=1 Tax=Paenibacillus dendritiformis TaxID=130049 RepID=UPI00387E1820